MYGTAISFGERLAAIRGERGLSQEELARAVSVSRRVIAYYEAESTQPPGALLADLARTLKVWADELLGLKPTSEKTPPKTARLRKRLQKVEQLPPADQRTVLKLVDALAEARRRTRRRAPAPPAKLAGTKKPGRRDRAFNTNRNRILQFCSRRVAMAPQCPSRRSNNRIGGQQPPSNRPIVRAWAASQKSAALYR